MKVGGSRHKLLRQLDAWAEGKNVVLREPDFEKWKANKESARKTEETGVPLQVHMEKINAREVWGDPFSKGEKTS